MLSEEVLKHVGVKGMRWGVRRNRNRPGGADGVEESKKIVDKRGKLAKNLDSLKRERQWKKVVSEMDKLSTKDINIVSKRIGLENSMKTLSKSSIATKKDRDDYLRRQNMSDAELSRKVVRLRAKSSLKEEVDKASKEQREFGEKVVNIAKTISIKYALKKSIGPKDVFDLVYKDGKNAAKNAKDEQDDLQKTILEKIQARQSNQ